MLSLESPSKQLALDSELENHLREVYGPRLASILSSMSSMRSPYYFRVNTLKIGREQLLQSMASHGLTAQPHDRLEEAAYFPVRESQVDTTGHLVEADKFAAEAVSRGAHLYAPGVKRCHGLRPGMKVTVTDSNGTPVGSGISHQSETSVLTYHQGLAVEIQANRTGLPSLMETPWYQEGQIHLQSLPAILTCHVLDPKPGETVVDLNCAPGGKASHFSQMTGNRARIIGFDRNEQKICRTRKLMQRMRCTNYQLIAHDSRYAHIDYNIKADRVLVDPPCTGLGIIPKLSFGTTMREVENLAAYQKQFLTAASHVAKQGGTIVYSVCTITGRECEEVVSFAEQELGLLLEDQNPFLGQRGLDPARLTQRFDPEIDGAGYFIARFTKK